MKVSPYIESLIPYKPGKPIEETQREYGLSEVYKLASNESPLGPSPKVIEALKKSILEIHRYPDASCYKCKQALSEYLSVPASNLVLGNGSNELIDLLIRVYCEPGDKILTSEAAFIAYKICAQVSRIETVEVPLGDGLVFDLDALFKAYELHKPKIIFIANPNNPTGTFAPKKKVREFVDKLKGEDVWLVFDEAYNEYVTDPEFESAVQLFSESGNVVVLRTFSKVFALAGLRVGAMIAPEEVIDYVNRIRNPFNVNSLAQDALVAALEDKEHLIASCEKNQKGREYFYKEFEKLGLSYIPSQGNFVLVETPTDAGELFESLLKKGIITRPVKGYGLPRHLRISVGREDENQKAIEALASLL